VNVSIKDITEENLGDIPEPCRSCLYWETPLFEQSKQKGLPTEEVQCEAMKATWFLKTLKEFGNCGKILYVDDKPIGYTQYSTANRLPNTRQYGAEKLGRAEENVVFISCLYISDENFRGKGLGKRLLDEVVVDLKKRGFKAVETFARRSSANNPSGPIELYLKKDFQIREEIDSDFSLVRLNL